MSLAGNIYGDGAAAGAAPAGDSAPGSCQVAAAAAASDGCCNAGANAGECLANGAGNCGA